MGTKSQSVIVGIDPGTSGGLAVIDCGLQELLEAVDMPVREGAKGRAEVDAPALYDLIDGWLERYQVEAVYIEAVHAVTRDSAMTAFAFGKAVGALLAVVELVTGQDAEMVSPQRWRWALPFKIAAGEKASAKQVSKALGWAVDALQGPRGGDRSGRIDAALIGFYGCIRTAKIDELIK